MITFENISKIYGKDTAAIDDVSFNIKKGEFVSLVGKSGAGKTTLLRLFLREEDPSSGKVIFDDQDISDIPSGFIPDFRRRIGTVFQDYKLLPMKTAYENVAYVMEVMGARGGDIKRDVSEVLKLVELLDRAEHFPSQLSGGEKQRVAIARALIHRPDVIVADEPTGNLDPYHTQDIINLLTTINNLGTTVILATHNKDIINRLGKRVITLDDGKLIRDEEKGKFVL